MDTRTQTGAGDGQRVFLYNLIGRPVGKDVRHDLAFDWQRDSQLDGHIHQHSHNSIHPTFLVVQKCEANCIKLLSKLMNSSTLHVFTRS